MNILILFKSIKSIKIFYEWLFSFPSIFECYRLCNNHNFKFFPFIYSVFLVWICYNPIFHNVKQIVRIKLEMILVFHKNNNHENITSFWSHQCANLSAHTIKNYTQKEYERDRMNLCFCVCYVQGRWIL